MRRITHIVACLLVFGISTLIADIVLTLAGASIGWYYGAGLCLIALTVFQILSPTGGLPVGRITARRNSPGDQRLSRSIH
ncbi:MAG TPA: hypothetical protein VIJ50_02115 [Solirubrobacteraceae bacterium]